MHSKGIFPQASVVTLKLFFSPNTSVTIISTDLLLIGLL